VDDASGVGPKAALLRRVSAFEVAGYEVGSRLGAGGSAEVWRGTELATGDPVALKRCRPGGDPAVLHREAAVLARLVSPYVVRLRAVVGDVLVLDLAAGGSLAGLLERRGALAPAEVVTVASPVASALAAVHAAGLVHGDVSPANVLFTAEGMPLLSDLGGTQARVVRATAEYLDPVVAGGGTPGPASDVWSLAAVCHHLLTGSAPFAGESVDDVLSGAVRGRRAPLGLLAPGATRALVAVVEAALSLDPEHRPSAEAFATGLLRAQAAEPVRLQGPRTSTAVPPLRETDVVPGPVPDPPAAAHRRERARRWPRPSVAALTGSALVAGLLGLGLTWALAGSHGSNGLPVLQLPSADPAPRWRDVLTALDGTRERAFATADPGLLDRVYLPGAAALAADRATVAALAASGRSASGVRHELQDVQQTSAGADRAELVVTDRLGPQTVVGPGGAVPVPGRAPTTYRVVLERRDGSWLVARLDPV
jgi:hypothetical protein